MSAKWAFILLTVMLTAAVAHGADPKAVPSSVGDQVYCVCGGCVATLNHCPHHESECSTKAEMLALIRKDVAAGKDETAILQDFVLRYGVKVLASPPAKGFNLTVWILPGVGVILGLGAVVWIVRKWRKPAGAASPAPPSPVDPKLLAAVEEEMKKVLG